MIAEIKLAQQWVPAPQSWCGQSGLVLGDGVVADIILGAPQWLAGAAAMALAFAALLIWAYRSISIRRPALMLAAALKFTAMGMLLICLLQPLQRGQRPRPQANLFPILVDTSRSMRLPSSSAGMSRGEVARSMIDPDLDWVVRLGQSFDVRHYSIANRLGNADPQTLEFDGTESASLAR